MEVEKLNLMKYRELQKVAKENGVKANLPKADLVKQLLEHFNKEEDGVGGKVGNNDSKDVSNNILGDYSSCDDTMEDIGVNLNTTYDKDDKTENLPEKNKVKLNTTYEKDENVVKLNETFEKSTKISTENKRQSRFVEFFEEKEDDKKSTEVGTKRKTRSGETPAKEVVSLATPQQKRKIIAAKRTTKTPLNKIPLRTPGKTPTSVANKTPVATQPESLIPRFVSFARKAPNFDKLHQKQFSKMENLVETVEKKQRRARTDTVNEQLKRAKTLTEEQIKGKTPSIKPTDSEKVATKPKPSNTFVPVVTSTAKKAPLDNFSFSAAKAPGGAAVQKSAKTSRRSLL
jgi:hypothetical protein